MNHIQKTLKDTIMIREQLIEDQVFLDLMESCIQIIQKAFQKDGKLLLCGNGGSAADAQHIAAELSGRFTKDRAPLFAEALHVNTSYLTAVANDYGFDAVYERMIEAMGREGDVLIGLSTSGNSSNVLKAIQKAKSIGMTTVAFLGQSDGKIGALADVSIHVPSIDTARIQEVHITMGHLLCEALENRMF